MSQHEQKQEVKSDNPRNNVNQSYIKDKPIPKQTDFQSDHKL